MTGIGIGIGIGTGTGTGIGTDSRQEGLICFVVCNRFKGVTILYSGYNINIFLKAYCNNLVIYSNL